MRKTISEIMSVNVAAKADSKGQLASSPGSTVKKHRADRVAIFRETAGTGKLEFDSHEAYIEEPEGRVH